MSRWSRCASPTRRSAGHTGFVLPILRDALAPGQPVEGLSLVGALRARMCAGCREDGTPIPPNDPRWGALHAAAHAARTRPAAWLEQRDCYGDLGTDKRFAEPFDRWLRLIRERGTLAALRLHCGMDGTQG
jgi:mannitol 2-dehydrogenase